MKRLFIALILVLALASPAFAQDNLHTGARLGMIASHAAAIGPGRIWIWGDSNIEGLWWNTLPARPELGWPEQWIGNAGIGWAGIEVFHRNAPGLLANTQPKVVVLKVGLADCFASLSDTPDWEYMYATVLMEIMAHGAMPIACTIEPISSYAGNAFDADRILRRNQWIRWFCAALGCPVIDLAAAWGMNGYYLDPDMSQQDGIHWTRKGQVEFFRAIEGPARNYLAWVRAAGW